MVKRKGTEMGETSLAERLMGMEDQKITAIQMEELIREVMEVGIMEEDKRVEIVGTDLQKTKDQALMNLAMLMLKMVMVMAVAKIKTLEVEMS